jgi:1,4-dihydroxy-2-naphthoate octaprenyltransferase
VTLDALVASLPVAALSTNILVVNNVRDREEDATTGKRTLAVRFGYTASRVEFVAMLVLAYVVPVWFVLQNYSVTVLLPWLSLPLAVSVTQTVLSRTDGEALNPALSRTGQLLAAYSMLFAVGFAV